ncbi:MarR family winged helix-turn-helix transcriptional regulator [Clostridium sp. Cult1]|uniref:MarR family winged helix-turn-helix transcriptional regulator n=1 Tax=Clostridium sp. Cult1 TaxID=2079002 RepID=UPI001F16DB3A|nr:MarR family transcriptional regulator [Clostridium sp. Cult1]MCF6462238.1 MarR family transcriptional regulator [Clostridium sp. Cult1]
MDNTIIDIRYGLVKFMSLFHRLFTPTFKKVKDDIYCCTKNQVRAIMILGKTREITPTILGKCMDMEKGSITTLIDSMENMNLVYREDDPRDKRKTIIKLSEEGKQYYAKQEEEFNKRIEELFHILSEVEINKFNESLKTIVEILEKVRDD